jgi:hypothetical protein
LEEPQIGAFHLHWNGGALEAEPYDVVLHTGESGGAIYQVDPAGYKAYIEEREQAFLAPLFADLPKAVLAAIIIDAAADGDTRSPPGRRETGTRRVARTARSTSASGTSPS